MGVGIIFLLTMPDNQLNARWLSAEDRVLAVERIRINQQGVGNKHFKWYQCREALLDPLTWAFVTFALISDIPNGTYHVPSRLMDFIALLLNCAPGGISNFFSQMIRSFGFTPNQSLLYGTPGGAVEVVTLIAWGYLGDKLHNRILVSCTGLLVSIVGMALIVGLPLDNSVGRLVGYYLTQSSPAPFVCLLSLVSTNVAGYTKKTTVAALYFIGYCIGNIIGPQTFRPSDAPRYVPAEVTILVCWVVCIGLMLFIYMWYRRENTRKTRIRANPEYVRLENLEWLDLTDSENPEFVYVL